MKHSEKAFTLVELAIVLVIIGLLTGGVLAGRELIVQAQLNALITEQKNYVRAYTTFRLKYNAVPGDMRNAYQIWGDDCGTDTTDEDGCNGNGDGIILEGLGNEYVKVWEHLSRSQLIAGTFDGSGASEGGFIRISSDNIPASRISGSYWNLSRQGCEGCGYGNPSYDSTNTTMLTLGSLDSNSDPMWLFPSTELTIENAFNIDKKMDDGRSLTGLVRSSSAQADCTDETNAPGDYYNLEYYGPGTKGMCAPSFILK